LKINRIMPFCNLFMGRPSYLYGLSARFVALTVTGCDACCTILLLVMNMIYILSCARFICVVTLMEICGLVPDVTAIVVLIMIIIIIVIVIIQS